MASALSSDKAKLRHHKIKQRYADLQPADLYGTAPNRFIIAVSLEADNGGREGVVCPMRPDLGAVALVDKTHRLATREEAEKYLAEVAAARKKGAIHTAQLEMNTHVLKRGLMEMAKMQMEQEAPFPMSDEPASEIQKPSKGQK